MSKVCDDGSVSGEKDFHTLNLKPNTLWHAKSTFSLVPALVNVLIGRVVTNDSGGKEPASNRVAWARIPVALRQRIRDRLIWNRHSRSRHKISPELAKLPMLHKWPDQHWKAVWRNPVKRREALYKARHACAVDGLTETEAGRPLGQVDRL